MYITSDDLKNIREKIVSNNLSFNDYLKYYRLCIVLGDNDLLKLLSETIPNNLNENNEDKFYAFESILKYKMSK